MKPVKALDRLRRIGLACGITGCFIAASKLGVFDRLVEGKTGRPPSSSPANSAPTPTGSGAFSSC